jgi:hypothetical protein
MIVENKNPPSVRFIRKHGRIIPIVSGKKSYKAEKILKQNIDEMDMEVKIAEAGRRFTRDDGSWGGHGSTFPQFFRDMGFKTKKQWNKAIEKQSGHDFDGILNAASDRHNFKVATKQIFDNKLVMFRTINGKVRPIRAKDENHYEFYNWKPKKQSDEVPF